MMHGTRNVLSDLCPRAAVRDLLHPVTNTFPARLTREEGMQFGAQNAQSRAEEALKERGRRLGLTTRLSPPNRGKTRDVNVSP